MKTYDELESPYKFPPAPCEKSSNSHSFLDANLHLEAARSLLDDHERANHAQLNWNFACDLRNPH